MGEQAPRYDAQLGGRGEGGSIARPMPGDLSIGSLITDSWALVKEYTVETIGGLLLAVGVVYGLQMFITFGIYLLMFVGMLGFVALEQAVGEDVATVLAVGAAGFGYTMFMSLIIVIQGLAFAGYQAMWIKIIRGGSRKIDYGRFFRAFALPLTLAALLNFAASMLGLLAFLVGAYVVLLGLMFMSFLVFDWGLTARQALSESWNLMRGHKLRMLGLLFALFGVNMVGMLTCGAGMLVTMPLSIGSLALFYDRIARPGNVFLRV